MFTVYLVTNQVNGKRYVGVTNKTPARKRWVQHLAQARRGANSLLYSAIRKYGKKEFVFEELAVTFNRDTANDLEIMLIAMFKTYGFGNPGYNMTRGGDGVSREMTDAEKERNSKRAKAMWQDPAKRESLKASMKGRPSHFKGKKRTAAHLANSVKARTEHYLTFQGETLSLREWSIRTGISRGTIHARLFRLGWDAETTLTEVAKPQWSPEMLALLGTMPDSKAAQILGKSECCVSGVRKWHGIKAWRKVSPAGQRIIVACKECGADIHVKPSNVDRYKYCKDCGQPLILEFNGERLTVTQWAEKLQINRTCLKQRIAAGWSVERILTTAYRHRPRLVS